MDEKNKKFYPLRGVEMMRLNPTAKIITYDELNSINTLNELFEGNKYDKVIILYLLHSRYSGHWVCLFKNDQGVNFFDSYGRKPDKSIDNLTEKQRKEYNEKREQIFKLLTNSCNKFIYNDYPLQDKKIKTQTCGCWVTHRLINSHFSDNEYIELFKLFNIQDKDEFVASYCLNRLKKK